MYTLSSDAAEGPPIAYEWRVWGFDSSATTPQTKLEGVSDTPTAISTATAMSDTSFRGDSRDDRRASATAAVATPLLSVLPTSTEQALLSSSAHSRSPLAVTNSTPVPSSSLYKGAPVLAGSFTSAALPARSTGGKGTPSQQSTVGSPGFCVHRKPLSGGAGVGTTMYTAASSAAELQHSRIVATPRDCDDGDDDDPFHVIKESIKLQLVSMEEEERVSDKTPACSVAKIRESLLLQPQPQQRCHLGVSSPSGVVRGAAAGASRTGGDAPIIQISTAAVPPAPRSAAAAAASAAVFPQGDATRMRCSSSVPFLEQQPAIRVGQSCVSKSGLSVASGGSSGGTIGFHSQPMPPSLPIPQVSTQKSVQLALQQPPYQVQLRHHQSAPPAVYQPNAAASRATLFEQQRQPLASGVGGTAVHANARGEVSIQPGDIRVPLPTSAARSLSGGRGAGEVVSPSISAEAARRTSLHKDPSRGIGGCAAAAATTRSSTTPTAASPYSTMTALQSGSLFCERLPLSKEEPVSAAHHHHHHHHHPQHHQIHSHQLHPGSSATPVSPSQDLRQPEIPAPPLEGSRGAEHATRHQEEDVLHGKTQPPQLAPVPPQPPQLSSQLQRVEGPSLMSFQGGPRFPNLPPHLQPQPLAQTHQPCHPHQLQPQSHQLQQQKLVGSASSPCGAMMPGKIYAATPHGRLISLTPDGVRVPQVEQPQHSLPPPPPSTASSSALTGNYVTASNYSALFCRNNPLHSMRYPGSESDSATRIIGEAGRAKVEKVSAVTTSSNAERPSAQLSNTTASSSEPGKDVSRRLSGGQNHGDAQSKRVDTRVTMSPTVTTASSPGAEAVPLPLTGGPPSAAGVSTSASSAVGVDPSKSTSATASVSCDCQSPTASVASVLVRGSTGSAYSVSLGRHGQRLASHPSSSPVSGGGCLPHIPSFPPRDDSRSTPSTAGAYHSTPSHTPLSASTSSGAVMSPLSRAQPTGADPDLNNGMGTSHIPVVPPVSPRTGGSTTQRIATGNGSGTNSASSGAVATGGQGVAAAAAGPMEPSNNVLGNAGPFIQRTSELNSPNSGLVVDVRGQGSSGHSVRFAHSNTTQPAFSASAYPAPYSPGASLGSVNGCGGTLFISTPASLPQQAAASNRPTPRTDSFATGTRPIWVDTVASPATQGSLGPPPPPQQQQQQLHFQGRSSLPPTPHSPAVSRLGAAAEDSLMATLPIRDAEGTPAAVVIAVPSLLSYTETEYQLYCHSALQQHAQQQQQHAQQQQQHAQQQQQQRQRQQQQRHRPPPPLPLPTSLKQQPPINQKPLAERQSRGICAGNEEEWRQQHQDFVTLQFEQRRQRLESELRHMQFQLEQQHAQQQQQSSIQRLQSSSPVVQPNMVTIDGHLYCMASPSSGEVFTNSGQPSCDFHLCNRDTRVGDGAAAAAEGRAEVASLPLHNRPGGHVPVSLHSQLPPPPPLPQSQQHMFVPIAGDTSVLREVNACAPAAVTPLAKPPPSDAKVMLMIPTPSFSHTAPYGY